MASSIYLYEILANTKSILDIFNILNSYTEDKEAYFNLELISDNEFQGEFYIINNVEDQIFNIEKRIFETITSTKANIIKFSIIGNKLEVWGNKFNTNKLIFKLSNLLKDVSFNAVSTAIESIIDKLENHSVKITKVSLNDVLFSEDIIGNFTVDLYSYGNPFSVLRKYKEKIVRLSFIYIIGEANIRFVLTANGNLTVHKPIEHIDEDVRIFIRDILL